MVENNKNGLGKLIAIEGIDGSGKGTQTKLLIKNLKERLYDVENLEFPQHGTDTAILLDAYLNGNYGKLSPKEASAMFALDRVSRAQDIRKWIEEGKIVIADRYTTSNMGHQAGKITDPKERDEFLDWLENFEYNELHIPRPDAVVYIDMPPEIAQENVRKKAERTYITNGSNMDIHEADINHLANSANAYRYVADKFDWLKLNPAPDGALKSIEENQKALWDLLFENGIIEKK